MTEYNPESGYPTINISADEQFKPDDTYTFEDGRSLTGSQMNEFMQYYFSEVPRGIQLRQYLDGEGPAPELLFAIVGDKNGGSVFLADSEVDVTEFEPLAGPLLSLLNPSRPIDD